MGDGGNPVVCHGMQKSVSLSLSVSGSLSLLSLDSVIAEAESSGYHHSPVTSDIVIDIFGFCPPRIPFPHFNESTPPFLQETPSSGF